MKKYLSFDDVLIEPIFSFVKSRKDVDLTTYIAGEFLGLPVISSNMDTVTGSEMSKAMEDNDGVGCLHRFMTIDENVKAYEKVRSSWVSIGLGNTELERAFALEAVGATTFVIDVAHGASLEAVNQYNKLSQELSENADIIVGNFATGREVDDFRSMVISNPAAFKIGIGGGSACTTRIKTGCGLPTLGSILDCKITSPGQKFIADGGMRTPGDIAKALAAGAHAVMLGGMLAGTDESPGQKVDSLGNYDNSPEFIGYLNCFKKYRGSASQESYQVQGKDESWRTAEGESFLVPYKGPVSKVLQDIAGGLRSAFTYVNATTLEEFQSNAQLVQITGAGAAESKAHGNARS